MRRTTYIFSAIVGSFLLACCTQPIKSNKPRFVNSSKKIIKKAPGKVPLDDRLYLMIDKIYTGAVYNDGANNDVFYRVLEIPDEENTMLIAEKISIGQESGNYHLLKRVQLTASGGALLQYGYLDTLAFADNTTIQGVFSGQSFKINMSKLP